MPDSFVLAAMLQDFVCARPGIAPVMQIAPTQKPLRSTEAVLDKAAPKSTFAFARSEAKACFVAAG